MEDKGLLSTLFDLSFSEFVTTRLIKSLFVLGMVFSGVWTLGVIIGSFRIGIGRGFLFLLLSPLIFFLCVFVARIWCELVIVVFRIAENTSRMAEKSEKSEA